MLLKMKIDIEEEIEIPSGIEVRIDKGNVTVKGPKGELRRRLINPRVKMEINGNKVMFLSEKATKREKTIIGTFKAHIRNMLKGAAEGSVYKLKICSSHFPMSVSVKGKEFIVQNFLGETTPRVLKLKEGVSVNAEGSEVMVESVDKELAGQTAASIERLCRIPKRDNRIFQDGIYITLKDGKGLK